MALLTAPPVVRDTHRPRPLPGRGARLVVAALAVGLSSPLTYRAAWSDWQFQSPVAELAIVPFIAFGLAVAAVLRFPFVRTTRLGLADLWVAATTLFTVGALQTWVLVQPGSYAWVLRFDALSLPLVMTASFSLLFGVRSLVVLWPAVAYSLLAWPLPASALVELLSGPVTVLTSSAIDLLLAATPSGPGAVRQGTDLLVTVSGLRGDFEVAVTSACSGLSGMLGILVVGAGLLYMYDGRLRSRLAWLAAGLVMVLVLNVVRILGLIAAGGLFGPRVALDVLHPYVGLVVLNVVLALMLATAARFGLVRRAIRAQATDNPLHEPGPHQRGRHRLLALRAAALMTTVLVLGLLNLQMASAAPAYQNSRLGGIHSLSGVLEEAAAPRYTIRSSAEQRWARKYFGKDSRWIRSVLESSSADTPTVWVDVLDTNSLTSLRTHSTMQCYRIHRQDVLSRRFVSLANGVLVESMAVDLNGEVWHVVTWERPIVRGDRVGHERTTLMASSREGAFAREFDDVGDPGSLRRRLVEGINSTRPGADPNPALSRMLLSLADDLEAAGTAAAWGDEA